MVARASAAAAVQRRPAQLELLEIANTVKRQRLRVQRRPTGEVARERLYRLMCEIGDLFNGCEYGWKAHVARELKIPHTTVHNIIKAGREGDLRSVRCETVDHAIACTGIPPQAFYDSEFRG